MQSQGGAGYTWYWSQNSNIIPHWWKLLLHTAMLSLWVFQSGLIQTKPITGLKLLIVVCCFHAAVWPPLLWSDPSLLSSAPPRSWQWLKLRPLLSQTPGSQHVPRRVSVFVLKLSETASGAVSAFCISITLIDRKHTKADLLFTLAFCLSGLHGSHRHTVDAVDGGSLQMWEQMFSICLNSQCWYKLVAVSMKHNSFILEETQAFEKL